MGMEDVYKGCNPRIVDNDMTIGEVVIIDGVQMMLTEIHRVVNKYPEVVFRPVSDVYDEISNGGRSESTPGS